MADEKKIRIGVDASNYEQYDNIIRRRAKEAMSEMIANARAYSDKSKDIINSLNGQIKLVEKRNQLNRDFERSSLESLKGKISPEEYRKRATVSGIEYKEEKLITQYLKSILEAILSTSKEELRQDKEGVERRIESVRRGEVKETQESYLKRKIQEEELRPIGDRGDVLSKNTLMRLGLFPSSMLNAQTGVDVAANAMTTGGGALSGIKGGVIGAIVAMTAGALLKKFGGEVHQLEPILGKYSTLTGLNVREAGDFINSFDRRGLASTLGIDVGSFIQSETELRLGAGTKNLGENIFNLLALGKATPLSTGDISSMVALRRYGGGSVSAEASFFEEYLKKSGQSNEALTETIKLFVGQANQIVQQTGRVNTNTLASLIANIGGQSGLQGVALQGAVGSISQGFQMSNDPVIRAIQLRSARSVAGSNASFLDLRKIMANPMQNPEYMQTVIENLRGVTGGGDMFEMALGSMFGDMNPNLIGKIKDINYTGDYDKKLKEILEKNSVDFSNESKKRVGGMEEQAASMKSFVQQTGYDSIQDIASQIMDISTFMSGFKDDLITAIQAAVNTGSFIEIINVLRDIRKNTENLN